MASHKARQSTHNERTKKYVKQFVRTDANLKRKGKTNKKRKAA